MTPKEFTANYQLPRKKSVKRVESWMVGAHRLKNLWNVYTEVSSEERKSPQFRLRSAVAQRPNIINFSALTEIVTGKVTAGRSIDGLIGFFDPGWDFSSMITHRTINYYLDDGFSFEQFLKTYPYSKVELLNEFSDGMIQPVTTQGPYIHPGVLDIHLNQTSPNPFTSWKRIEEGIAKLRKQKPGRHQKVRGVSWLLTPENQVLDQMGLTTENGRQQSYPDINSMLRRQSWLPSETPATPQEVIQAAFCCILNSRKNIRQFLVTGTLPDIGVVQVPAEVFFQPSE